MGQEKIQVFFMLTGSAIVLVVILTLYFFVPRSTFCRWGWLVRPPSNVTTAIGEVRPERSEMFELPFYRDVVEGYGKMVDFSQADIHSLQKS